MIAAVNYYKRSITRYYEENTENNCSPRFIMVFQQVDYAAASDDGWKLKKKQDGIDAYLQGRARI